MTEHHQRVLNLYPIQEMPMSPFFRKRIPAWLCLLAFLAVPLWSEQFPLRILHTNDWHGTIQPLSSAWLNASEPRLIGGAGVLGTALNRQKLDILRRGGRYLLLDAGDLFQGSMEVNLTQGLAMIDLYNHLGYVVTALGNHDFDYGPQALRQAYEQAHFTPVCANLDGHDRFWRRSVKLRVGPLKIGIFGLITPDLPSVSVKKNLAGVQLRNVATAAAAEATALRRDGCDLVVLLSHCGHPMDRLLAWWTPDIDVIIGGHSQDHLNQPVVTGKTLIVQTRGYGSHLGDLTLQWSTEDKRIATWTYASHLLDPQIFDLATDTIEAVLPHIELVRKKANEPVAWLDKPLSKGVDGSDSEIGWITCRAIRERSGQPIAVFHRNGIRNDLARGLVTFGTLYQVLPFEHEIMTGEMSGEDLLQVAAFSLPGVQPPLVIEGLEPVGTSAGSPGWRQKNGAAIEKGKWYPIAFNDFLAQGGDRFVQFARVRNPRETRMMVREVFMESLREQFPPR